MWKWLRPYTKTERSYQLAGRLLPWFAIVSLSCFLVGTTWGLLFAPLDYEQANSMRIIYIHVPAAMMSMAAYVGMAIAAFIGLVWQHKQAYIFVAAIAPVGACFTLIALITGSLWGKPMWGAYWIWDARLTSELVLLFSYLGVIALYHAYMDKNRAGEAAGMLALVGVINVPIIHFSVEWWSSLHQKSSLSLIKKTTIDAEMLWPLLINIAAFSALLVALSLWRFRNELLSRELHRPWVVALLKKADVVAPDTGKGRV